jgi:hypothetical protein
MLDCLIVKIESWRVTIQTEHKQHCMCHITYADKGYEIIVGCHCRMSSKSVDEYVRTKKLPIQSVAYTSKCIRISDACDGINPLIQIVTQIDAHTEKLQIFI